MSDCKGCKYWTQAIDDYANGKHTDKEPNPFCSTCEGDKYQQRGAKETKASMGAKIDAQAAEIEALKAKVAELEADNARMREALQELYNLNLCPDYKTGASRENLFAEIAREALKGEG